MLELAGDGLLITMTPTGGDTGARNHTLNLLLGLAARASGLPLKLFDSTTGFRLADGSVLSPEQRRGLPPLCPDLVIELASTSGASPSDEGPRGATALRLEPAMVLEGGEELPGLRLDLAELWAV